VLDTARVRPVRAALHRHVGPRQIARLKGAIAPALRGDLTRLGRWYGTNKASGKQLYTPFYECHLDSFRRRPLRLLEIGIGGYGGGPQAGGASLRMWRSWMPKARVVGIDLHARDFCEPRISTFAGSQSDGDFLRRVEATAGPFDVVIDDGSHVSSDVTTTFDVLWPLLRPGGVYVIEDLGTSYLAEFGGGPPGTPGTSIEMLKQLIDEPTRGGDVGAVHVYPHIAFVQKRCPEPAT
jgi:Methyltransferase domain